MKIHASFFRFAASVLAAIVCLKFSDTARAQSVPPLVNYQGRLANPDGSALPTADYQLTFNIYDAATNGTLVWGPQMFDGTAAQGHGARIPIVQGFFNVMLGPVDVSGVSLANAFGASNRFVEITVTNHAPIAPRQQILTTPFAFNSAKLSGADWSAVFGTNDPVNGKILGSKFGAGSISITNLTARQIATNVGIGGIAISPSCGVFTSPAPSTPTLISNFSVTITTQGNPVEISFASDGSTNEAIFFCSSVANSDVTLNLVRDGNFVVPQELQAGAGSTATIVYQPPGIFRFLDFPTAGIHNYQVQIYAPNGGIPKAYNTRMIAREF